MGCDIYVSILTMTLNHELLLEGATGTPIRASASVLIPEGPDRLYGLRPRPPRPRPPRLSYGALQQQSHKVLYNFKLLT